MSPADVIPLASRESTVPLTERDDDELALLARGGRTEAFDLLVRRHQPMVLRCATKYLGDPTRARDAAQRAFVEVYGYLPRYQGRGRFRQFLVQVLVNQVRMLQRSRGNRRRALAALAELPAAPAEMPDEALLRREQRRDVDRALLLLSDKLRAVVVLRFVAELSYQEISDSLEIPLGTVKSRLAAGVTRLRELLEEGEP